MKFEGLHVSFLQNKISINETISSCRLENANKSKLNQLLSLLLAGASDFISLGILLPEKASFEQKVALISLTD